MPADQKHKEGRAPEGEVPERHGSTDRAGRRPGRYQRTFTELRDTHPVPGTRSPFC